LIGFGFSDQDTIESVIIFRIDNQLSRWKFTVNPRFKCHLDSFS
jgi:hypothetical protein